jgi:hypothetical protein
MRSTESAFSCRKEAWKPFISTHQVLMTPNFSWSKFSCSVANRMRMWQPWLKCVKQSKKSPDFRK